MANKNQNKYIIKIIATFIFTYIIVRFLVSTVFLSNSPRINRLFLVKINSMSRNLAASLLPKSSLDFKQFENMPSSALQSMSKGVYAGKKNDNIVYIRVTKDIEYEERIVTYEGKTVRVRFPKGTFK